MYCRFFGFSERPFDLTPDPKFLYLSPSHRETLATLYYGIQERRGFVAIVSEVGTGKTTLLNTVLSELDEQTRVVFIYNTDLTFGELLTMILVDLDLAKPGEELGRTEAFFRLQEFAIRQFSSGGNIVLVVDEAQHLDRAVLENLRLLSNLETRRHKLIQIVLCGQPELAVKLNQPELRQLAQRIVLRRHLSPLKEREIHEYIQHRLRMVDYMGPELFSREAVRLIWKYSAGVPRKINVLCDNALLIAYALEKRTVEAAVIDEAIRDLGWGCLAGSRVVRKQPPVRPTARLRPKHLEFRSVVTATAVAACFLVVLSGLLFGASYLGIQGREVRSLWTSIQAKIPSELVRLNPLLTFARAISREQSGVAEEIATSSRPQQKPEPGNEPAGANDQ